MTRVQGGLEGRGFARCIWLLLFSFFWGRGDATCDVRHSRRGMRSDNTPESCLVLSVFGSFLPLWSGRPACAFIYIPTYSPYLASRSVSPATLLRGNGRLCPLQSTALSCFDLTLR